MRYFNSCFFFTCCSWQVLDLGLYYHYEISWSLHLPSHHKANVSRVNRLIFSASFSAEHKICSTALLGNKLKMERADSDSWRCWITTPICSFPLQSPKTHECAWLSTVNKVVPTQSSLTCQQWEVCSWSLVLIYSNPRNKRFLWEPYWACFFFFFFFW